ncbi:MAG: hypothetical protein LUC91_06755 [Prevotella sp.]|nr:hypothetical protein [Prevotella sp.]
MNERDYAEQCIKDGNMGDKPYNTLMILAKYYYSIGLKNKKISENLKEFLEENYPKYKHFRKTWDDTVESIVRKAKRYPLYENDGVWITQSELDKIEELKTKTMRRVMFTILCLAKLGNLRNDKNNGWVNNDRKEIYTLARVNCSVAERNFKIGDLKDLGYLQLAKKNGNLSVRVTFIDNDGKKVLFISDFRELGYEYLKYCGENFIRCQDCGILVRGNKAGTRKRCNNCEGYTRQDTKIIVCADCGKQFRVNSHNTKTTRCADCYEKYRRDRKLETQRQRRKNTQMKSEPLKDDLKITAKK